MSNKIVLDESLAEFINQGHDPRILLGRELSSIGDWLSCIIGNKHFIELEKQLFDLDSALWNERPRKAATARIENSLKTISIEEVLAIELSATALMAKIGKVLKIAEEPKETLPFSTCFNRAAILSDCKIGYDEDCVLAMASLISFNTNMTYDLS